MDVELRLDLKGNETTFLANTTNFITTLGDLEAYKSAPADLSYNQMAAHLGHYKGYFEAGKNGDRINIALRNDARESLTSSCKKALHYLQAVATEEDLPKLLQGGVKVYRRPRRKAGTKAKTSAE